MDVYPSTPCQSVYVSCSTDYNNNLSPLPSFMSLPLMPGFIITEPNNNWNMSFVVRLVWLYSFFNSNLSLLRSTLTFIY